MLYLASDNFIPISIWSKDNPKVAFNNPVYKPKHFFKGNVYYVNSTECCGCGFRQETDISCPDSTEPENKNENQLQLYKHISQFLENEDFIQLFGCWAGEEDNLETRKEISASELLNKDFYFAENELITVKK